MSPPNASRRTVSLLFPAFNEFENAEGMVEFFRQVSDTYTSYLFEMVVVDDGSTDGTAERVWELVRPDEAVQVIRLSRNFGSHAALSAGLAHVSGDAAISLSADRQEPLEAIGDFLQQWADGADLVWGLRSVRAQQQRVQGSLAESFSKIFQRRSDVPTYPADGPSQALLSRRVIDALNAMPEVNRNLWALAAWTGFDQRSIRYEQLPRPYGTSKWTFTKKLKLVVDSFVEFSRAPLEWFVWAGGALVAIGVLLLIVALIAALTAAATVAVVATICGTVAVVGGINLTALGLLAEYVWRVGDDARRRPLYVIESVARRDAGSAGPVPD
jgi:dolichol-phosphate mannosyltransferase